MEDTPVKNQEVDPRAQELVDWVVARLTPGRKECYVLREGAGAQLADKLRELEGTEAFPPALQSLLVLAFALETRARCKSAAKAILEALEAATLSEQASAPQSASPLARAKVYESLTGEQLELPSTEGESEEGTVRLSRIMRPSPAMRRR